MRHNPNVLCVSELSQKSDIFREILRKVNSRKIRKDFEYLSHGEILDQIEKMQKNAIYLKTKFGIGHLMPQQAHVAMVHREGKGASRAGEGDTEEDTEEEGEEEDVAESDGNISRASFASGKEIYLSRAEILGKIQKLSPKKSPREGEKEKVLRKRLTNKHDSWSSRASSILKDPEAIYVSRVELLKKIDVHEEPRQRGGRRIRAEPRQHDSWSSRASSILAAVEAEQVNRASSAKLTQIAGHTGGRRAALHLPGRAPREAAAEVAGGAGSGLALQC